MTRYSKEHCKKNSNLSEQNSASYVGNLHKNASENVLQALFAVIGNVVDIKMINDAALSTSHYCFITYETHLGAQRALAAMNGRDVYKMPLKVNWATRPDGIKKDTSSKLTFIFYRF
jgi:nucleolysin TIA-1/TIAR